MKGNVHSWQKMGEHLETLGFMLSTMPIVLQCNKQDLPQALDPETIRNMLNIDCPVLGSVAFQNIGVADTFKAITQDVIQQVQLQLA